MEGDATRRCSLASSPCSCSRRRPEAFGSAKAVSEPDELATPSEGARHRRPTGRASSVTDGATVVLEQPPALSSTGASPSAKRHHLFVDPSRSASMLRTSAAHFLQDLW